jgi:SAM-dependent methyltransferase
MGDQKMSEPLNPNQKTLLSYEESLQKYIDRTPQQVSGGVRKWIDATLALLPIEAKIIEIGSAFGRDAAYIAAKGYAVECTDAAQSFVSFLQKQGISARLYNVVTDPFSGQYDLIFANAVFLHFTREELASVITKCFIALNNKGRLSFSLKQGEGETWSDEKIEAPRYFCYWQQNDVEKLLNSAGFSHWTIDDDGTGHGSAKWLHVIAHKA